MWDLLLHEEFAAWLLGLPAADRTRILAHAELLRTFGPALGRPQVDTLKGSRHANMKELRLNIGGEPWRVIFAFDPNRAAILLVGGGKAGDKRWYKRNIPIADDRYDAHLARLAREGE